jgi:hypothetical protein
MELLFLIVGISLLMVLALVSPGSEALRRPLPLVVGHHIQRRTRHSRQASSRSSRSRLAPRFTRA